MPTTKATSSIYQLKIMLLGIEPPILAAYPGSEAVVGWTDSHLHQFEKDGKYWGVPESDDFGDLELLDESKVPAGKVLLAEGDSMVYVYDFGGNWRHGVLLGDGAGCLKLSLRGERKLRAQGPNYTKEAPH